MRKVLTATLALLAVCGFVPRSVACGDKFLLIGRSIRYEEAYAAKHPASVLVYSNPATGFSKVAGEVAAILQKAGHRPVMADGPGALADAFRAGTFDVVFCDLADVDAVQAAGDAAGSKALVLTVLHDPTGEELKAAEKTYTCVLKAKGKDKHFLAVVNEVKRLRAKGQEPDCRKA